MSRRVVVTGLGIISPLGTTLKETVDSLLSSTSGIGPIASIQPPPGFPARCAGEVRGFQPRAYGIKAKNLKVMNRSIQYALAAAHLALEDAGACPVPWQPPDLIGLCLGVEGIQYNAEELLLASYEAVGNDMRRYCSPDGEDCTPIHTRDPGLAVHPLWPLSVLPNMALCHISIQHGIMGPNLAFSSIDAAGMQAIGEGSRMIREGMCDACLVGGAYGLNSMHILSLASQNMLSADGSCRLFDSRDTGCVPGEGAAVLVLEDMETARRRGVRMYAEVAGYAARVDADASPPYPENRRMLVGCIADALEDAGIPAEDTEYVHAGGTGVYAIDRIEIEAIGELFGAGTVPVGTVRALSGHLLPAAGALDAAITALSIHTGCIAPAAGCPENGAGGGLYFPHAVERRKISSAVTTTCGMHGEHAVVAFKSAQGKA